nr:hypothetical protein [Tanacetum cinerariifolium]
EIRLTKRLLYDNSSPRPPEEFVSENSNADIESFSPSPIPVKDSDSFMEEIDLSYTPDDPMPPGIEDDDYDSERDILILVQYSRKCEDSCQMILSSKSSFPQLQLRIHGSTTTHSYSKYDSFIFDLANDQFPPTDRSDLTYEEFVDELAHIISPTEYDCFYFRNFPDPGELMSILNSGIRENLSSTTW